MKKMYVVMAMLLGFVCVLSAQNVQEPEFELEPFVYNLQDSTLDKPLACENAYVKAKAGASMYLTGLGKVKSYIYVNGVASPLVMDNSNVIVINTGGKSPMQTLSINKFEVLKKKRRFQTGHIGSFSGASANNDEGSQNFRYKKIGNGSVLISLKDFEAGEYCLSVINEHTNSKTTKVYTFSIK